MKYEIKIITEKWEFTQTVKADGPEDAIKQVSFVLDETLDEFTLVCKRKDAPEGV